MNEIMNREDLLKIAKPILFSTPMVRAIQEDRKTATRRVIKFPEGMTGRLPFSGARDYIYYPGGIKRARYKVGDILYVRETWCRATDRTFRYKSNIKPDTEKIRKAFGVKWRPSIHMPKEAARIFLKVTDVKIERLQDICYNNEAIISEWGTSYASNFYKEGFFMAGEYVEFWNNTISKKDIDIYGWDANPWVEVAEFEKIEVE